MFEHEPVSPDAPIMHAPHTVLTSHAAYWSEESAVELRTRCTQNAIDVVLGRAPENCVNPEALPPRWRSKRILARKCGIGAYAPRFRPLIMFRRGK